MDKLTKRSAVYALQGMMLELKSDDPNWDRLFSYNRLYETFIAEIKREYAPLQDSIFGVLGEMAQAEKKNQKSQEK